jgi:hypothetical protein
MQNGGRKFWGEFGVEWGFPGTDPAGPWASSCQLRSGVSPVPKSEGSFDFAQGGHPQCGFWGVESEATRQCRLMFSELFRAGHRRCGRKDRDQGVGSGSAGPRSARIVRKAKTKAKASAGPSTPQAQKNPHLLRSGGQFLYLSGQHRRATHTVCGFRGCALMQGNTLLTRASCRRANP